MIATVSVGKDHDSIFRLLVYFYFMCINVLHENVTVYQVCTVPLEARRVSGPLDRS